MCDFCNHKRLHSKGKFLDLYNFFANLGLLLAFNWILFALTSWTLYNHPRLINNSRPQEGRRMLKLHLKLFTIMGLSWLFELLSWAWPSEDNCWPWYIWTDLINTLQGVWILLIYVAKKEVLRKLQHRCSAAAEQ